MPVNSARLTFAFALVTVPLAIAGLIFVFLALFLLGLPDVEKLKGCLIATMNSVSLCPKQAGYTRLDQISPVVLDAIVVSEDAAFFHHGGFDWHEIRESFSKNLAQGRIKRGGSTITQQLAKNVFLDRDKSIIRKLREALIAHQIEQRFSKKEILERYLNVVEFGPNLYGIKSAAQHYFDKAPAELHALEAAFLAFLLPNPKGYYVSFTRGQLTPFAKNMVALILRRMESFKKIDIQTKEWSLTHIDDFPWKSIKLEITEDLAPDATALSPEQIEHILDQERAPVPSQEESLDF